MNIYYIHNIIQYRIIYYVDKTFGLVARAISTLICVRRVILQYRRYRQNKKSKFDTNCTVTLTIYGYKEKTFSAYTKSVTI